MVVQGERTTLPVTLDEMVYHTRSSRAACGARTWSRDMPFMSYQASLEDGMRAAGRLMKEGGAEAVKLEGGVEVRRAGARGWSRAGIPVMGHIGLTPQSVHQFGGFKVQGRTDERRAQHPRRRARGRGGRRVRDRARGHAARAGRRDHRAPCRSPTIGIGAGPDCDGQVLVMHDLLGLEPAWKPRFVRRYAEMGKAVGEAFAAYAADVRAGRFPSPGESYD